MEMKNPELWNEVVRNNPVPEGWGRDPRTWPTYEDMTEDQRGDGYGACVVIAAAWWAEEMERRLRPAHVTFLADIPDRIPPVAGVAEASFATINARLSQWGLTGFQYGLAVQILADVWEHGDELRRWHNLETQIHDEGEAANEAGKTLNPALLTTQPKEE